MEKDIPQFLFSVSRILDSAFSVDEMAVPELTKLIVGYGMNFGFNIQGNWVEYSIRADFKEKGSEEKDPFISGTALTRFHVPNLGEFYNSKTDQMEFPNGALDVLFGIAFSHLRAFLSKNLASTKFSGIYLPVINPADVFQNLLHKNMSEYNRTSDTNKVHKKK